MAHDDDDEITREARTLTEAYRRRAEPPPAAAELGWQTLHRRIAAGEPDPLGDTPIAAPKPRWRPWAIGLAAAAALLIALRLSPRTAEQSGLGGAIEAVFQRLWGSDEQTAPVHGPHARLPTPRSTRPPRPRPSS
jgi:hypothetical protein